MPSHTPRNFFRELHSILIVVFLTLLPCSAAAAGAGTSAATFLELGYGARPFGLGEAFAAVADDVAALH
ncbi:MAG: hypothetical protein NTY77_20380 [Elusimicrobia bacterium]|nr:hypothetical protein [Elusimicrobiota bacterium]